MRLKSADAERLAMKTLRGRLSRLLRAKDGVAAIEFALILPVMVLLYCGLTDLSFALTADRKLTNLSRSLADLVGRSTNIDDTEKGKIFAAASAIMQPYPASNVPMVISSIAVKYANGKSGAVKGVVCWSEADHSGVALSADAAYPLPPGFDTPNTSFIVADAKTTYTPMFGSVLKEVFKGAFDLEEKTVWPVRNVKEVTRNGRGCLT